MGAAPGFVKLVKAGFVQFDAPNAKPKIIVFQYNPETLVRRLDAVNTPELARETVSFTLALDAADKLEHDDTLTKQAGLLPIISALELLLYPAAGSLTVWVSGNRRIVPVRITEMQFVEQAFDPMLHPIRAEVSVSLQVLTDADLATGSHGRGLWDAYFTSLQQLAKSVYDAGSLTALGLNAV